MRNPPAPSRLLGETSEHLNSSQLCCLVLELFAGSSLLGLRFGKSGTVFHEINGALIKLVGSALALLVSMG